ncbi:putative peptidyl-tRNA hydrolase PTRHD1 [Selaginella moellendorffii]|nr:putative peptidyl-tRNA hydrolase PTRHD1 [Selaginella moellendorffii]|eukprot:XP_002979308.2 putative peptidyl-tRNA hydrolase PTRHD1 [Selaginella moellendorffii]
MVVIIGSRIAAPLASIPRFPAAPRSRFASCKPMAQEIPTAEAAKEDVLIQYVVIRKDLVETMKWPLGSVISQGCHAAVAAVWMHRGDPDTIEYCSPEKIDTMHKVTLEVKGEIQLLNLSKKLAEASIDHKLWIEQPENLPTCLATKPCWKSRVSSHFKKLKLCS